MPGRFASLLAIALLVAGCRPATATPAPSLAPTLEVGSPTLFDTPWSDRSLFAAGLDDSQQAILAGLPGASVYHLDLTIASDLLTFDGAEEVLYTNTEGEPLEQVAMHLFPNLLGGEMTLSAIRVDGVDVQPFYGEGDGSIMVPLTPALAPGASTVIRIDFHVRVPQDLELNYGVLASADGVLAYAHGYPMIAVFDADGWNLDVPPPYGDITYADASFYLVRVHAPADLVLCGSGTEVSRKEAGDGLQEVVLATGPARDFYLAASREYQVITRTSGDYTLRICAPDGTQEKAERALDIAARALDAFGQWYAEYPYSKLDIVSTPTLALGIEYPGAFALNGLLLTPDEDFGAALEDVWLESTTVHEAAHEWFYNLVGNDQLEDPWLDESLAQYATLAYYADRYGEAGASGMRDSFYGRWDRVGREPIPIGKPVAEYDEAAYSAIVYGRGPLFFEALQQRLGESGFNALLRDYSVAFSWEEATPEDLQRMAEAQCECDLHDLFNEWVYGEP
jgi:aminopeptidase N